MGAFPLRLFWLELPKDTESATDFLLETTFSVPKKKFKRANRRNKIKRQMREIYRIHRLPLLELLKNQNRKLICLWFYGGDQMPEFDFLKTKMLYLLDKITQQFRK